MTVTESMAHVSMVSMASAAAAQKAGGPVALFKSAAVTNYAPDGVQKASVGTLSLENVQLAADGSLKGGQITHTTLTPEGKPVLASTMQLAPGGKLTQAETTIYNHNDAGVANVLSTDLSSMQWTDSGKLGSGEIQLSSKHPLTGAQTASGKLVFQNEKLVSGAITHYSAQNPTAVDSLTDLDYTGVNLLGMKVAGGQLKVTRKQPDQTISSTSQVSFQEDGSGRINQIQTANLDPKSGQVKSNVTSDYSGVTYDARNVLTSGDVHIHVTAPDQSPISHAVVTFANATPQSSQTWRFQGNVLAAKVLTDFSNAKFDNQNRVVSGGIKVDVFDGSENQLSSTNVTYDGKGGVANKATQKLPPATAPAPPRAFADVAKAWTSVPPKAPPAKLLIQKVAGAPSNAKNTYRKDGTLEESVVTTSANGVPLSAEVTRYDTDGKTVASTYQVDLSKVSMAGGPGKPSGSVSVAELTAGVKKNSDSVFTY